MFCAKSETWRMPNPTVEKPTAKIKTVNIRAILVLGIIVAGRRVSCAAWEIDSSPTNEIMARLDPYMNLLIGSVCNASVH